MRAASFYTVIVGLAWAVMLWLSAPAAAQTSPPPPLPGATAQFGDFRGMFQALTDPPAVPASKLTALGEDEEVLGLTLGGQSRAYPARFIAWHHVVNDTLGGKSVVVTYCSVCNSGVAFDPMVEGKRRIFGVFGLYRGVMAMIDPSTETVWSHLAGEALLGPDKGKTLAAWPVVNTTWGEWKSLHPDTTTPGWDTGYARFYRAKVISGRDYLPPMFAPTLQGLRDDRLPSNALVLAVRVEGQPRVYPFAALAAAPDVVQETLGSTPLAAFFVPATKASAAFDRRLDGKALDFVHAAAPGQFQDRGTGSFWTVEGRCVSGALKGRQLTRLFSLQAEWYGWSAYFPQTTIYAPPAAASVPPSQ